MALYLDYCAARRLVWSAPSFLALTDLQRWLVSEPLPPRGQSRPRLPRYRSTGTANAVMTAVADFLRFGRLHGWVQAETAELLSEPKLLRFLPAGCDAGEGETALEVQVSRFRFKTADPGFEVLDSDQIQRAIAQAGNARDRFLAALLACTGLRIGEALGLRRGDMHFLASSRPLGCQVEGPHLHVHRRTDNPNRALAKSRTSRHVPVTADLVAFYADYQYERDRVAAAAVIDMVFVNLFRPPLGSAMSYSSAKDAFDRLAHTVGHALRPHMLRHSAATRWLREDVSRDVVQRLLGHRSIHSMERYRNPRELHQMGEKSQVGSSREGREALRSYYALA
ncbi:tyrosine-type recombinase/integrase, partial [Kitasatospora sp. NPDC101155]|uniref:tyrosine-type recombinase/integrase n=1 Tax=Kitasatospora sp. NPDC101155 TaxID=3364097 RepID=UPI003825E264